MFVVDWEKVFCVYFMSMVGWALALAVVSGLLALVVSYYSELYALTLVILSFLLLFLAVILLACRLIYKNV